MRLVTGGASKRRFEGFVAEASETLFRTGCLMTGDVKEAEDLVQETFIQVARRWHRVRPMDYPVSLRAPDPDQPGAARGQAPVTAEGRTGAPGRQRATLPT